MTPPGRRLAAEAIATALLLAAIVGSGIMAERLAGGSVALALLANSIATGAMLVVLITLFGPLSGAHLNPAVSAVAAVTGSLRPLEAAAYAAAQVTGAVAGVLLAHVMFDLPAIQTSGTARTGLGQWVSEAVATAGLILVVLGSAGKPAGRVAVLVGLYIVAAYWFTASTSFANPAVTIARSLTATFAGIAPADAPAFILAQAAGAAIGLGIGRILWHPAHASADSAGTSPAGC